MSEKWKNVIRAEFMGEQITVCFVRWLRKSLSVVMFGGSVWCSDFFPGEKSLQICYDEKQVLCCNVATFQNNLRRAYI